MMFDNFATKESTNQIGVDAAVDADVCDLQRAAALCHQDSVPTVRPKLQKGNL